MNELITLLTSLSFKPAEISFDDSDKEKSCWIKEQIRRFSSIWEQSEDSKRTATMLNGIANELDNARKSVKGIQQAFLKEFEGKVNDVRDEESFVKHCRSSWVFEEKKDEA